MKHSQQLQAIASCLPTTVSVQQTFKALAAYSRPISKSAFTCFPKIATIAQSAGLSVRTIHYHLKTLTSMGVVSVHQRYRTCKKTNQARRISSLYTINVVRLKQLLHKLKVRVPVCSHTLQSKNSSYRADRNKGFNHARYAEANQIHDQTIQEMVVKKMEPKKVLAVIGQLRRKLGLKSSN